MDLEDIKKQLDENSKKIIDNMDRIHQNSGAIEILKDFKGDNKRLFAILLIVLLMWFTTIVYLVYVLTDTSIVSSTEITQENQEGYNNYIGNDGEISNGEANN